MTLTVIKPRKISDFRESFKRQTVDTEFQMPVPVSSVRTPVGESGTQETTLNVNDDIRHSFSSQRYRLMLARGVSHDTFMRRGAHFSIADSIVEYQTNIPGVATKLVSPKKQLITFNSLVEKPLAGNPVICISSFPSDLRAKHLALFLFNRAIDTYNTTTVRRIRSKSAPLWHRVYSGYHDAVLSKFLVTDDSPDYPCCIVLTNIDVNSSKTKLEKVRDILDRFSDIPRIVTVSPEDPLTFFATRLHVMVTAGLMLGPGSRRTVTL